MKLTRLTAILLALSGAGTGVYMLVSYFHLSPPLPLSDPRSDSIGNVQGSIFFFVPAVLVYAFLARLYLKQAFKLTWHTRAGVALLSWGIAGGAILLTMHRGEVEAAFFSYAALVAVVCSLATIAPPFITKDHG